MNTFEAKVLTNQHVDDLEGYLTKDSFHHLSSDMCPILNRLSEKLAKQVMPRLCKSFTASKTFA